MTVDTFARAGGLFALLDFTHRIVDWVFQSHAEAMQKHNNPVIRARHCLIYACGFLPLLGALGVLQWRAFACWNVLFWSHFAEDTYYPVYLWAKYIRRPPEMTPDQCSDPRVGFSFFVGTTLGKILMIEIDQIIHLAFLWVVVAVVMWK